MRLTPSDPDIATLVGRIESKEIDLQPDFQRGEVWGMSKKQRLIDSILRDWHIPPIHLVTDEESQRQSVLDGQQRLAAIRDFKNNQFPVDGGIEPHEPDISSLDGLSYNELPPKWKRQFDQFTIRVFRITDYDPSEPGELFYRLNQPSSLTAAETRNAFYGKTRGQVKQLVEEMKSGGLDTSFWGFSNARMAYDDVIARTCLILDNETLKKKITSTQLADQYRSGKEFTVKTIEEVEAAIQLLKEARVSMKAKPNLNKATAQSWLIFLACVIRSIGAIPPQQLASFVDEFEQCRASVPEGRLPLRLLPRLQDEFGKDALIRLVRVYEDRSTSRVADTTSVILRDFVLWMTFYAYLDLGPKSGSPTNQFNRMANIFASPFNIESDRDVEELAMNVQWGSEL